MSLRPAWFTKQVPEQAPKLHREALSPKPETNKQNKTKRKEIRAHFDSSYTKTGTIQRRLAWPLRKDDTQIREAFHIQKKRKEKKYKKVSYS